MIGVVADCATVTRMHSQPDLPPTGLVTELGLRELVVRPILGEDATGRALDLPIHASPLHADLPRPPVGSVVPLYRHGYEILHGPPCIPSEGGTRDISIENVEQGKGYAPQEDREPTQ